MAEQVGAAGELRVSDPAVFLRSILEGSTEYSIVGKDLAGTVVAWNEGARRVYGYEATDVVGKASAFILHDPDFVASGRAQAILDEARQMGKWSGELGRVRKDGTRFTAFVTITLRRDDAGEPIGFTMISRDLTESQRILRELRESQEYNRGLIESNIDALMTTDPLGVISDVNRQMCEMTGYSREELIGSPFKSYFTEPARAEDGIRQVLGDDRVTNYELVMRSRSGRETVVSYNATTFRSADGKLKGVFAAARDITAQKRLEEQIRQQNRELTETTAFLNNVLESSTEYSIIAKDLDGMILAWNEGARRNYGYTAEDMVGKTNSRILHAPEDIASGRAEALLGTALRTGKAEGVFERVRRNGQRFTASVAVTLRRDAGGTPIGYVLISKDITEQKLLEEQLRRKNEELEEQNRRVQEANRLKSEFLANMSHELRTPLNGIIGFAQLMHGGKVGPVSATHQEYLGDILTSAKHLLQLINDVLDLSKVESGKMEFRPELVDLGKLVSEVRDVVRAIAAQKRIEISTDVSPALAGVALDPSRFKQILYNYLSNALKFTPDGGRVAIRLLPEGLVHIRLDVVDTGIGIKAEDLGRLFVEFQQLDASTAKKYQGTGLGLALTRRLVEAQGGRVDVESKPGRGSTFSAILPRMATSGGTSPGPDRPRGVARRGAPTILVVEDDPRDRHWLVETLGKAGYAVDVASTGKQAIELGRRRAYDAITLDLLLPDLSGWEVLREIRAAGPNEATPTVVVTVVSEKGAALGFAVSEFLVKPVQPEELLDALERVGVLPGGGRTVLVVDDDPNALKLAESVLRGSGFRSLCLPDAREALDLASQEPPSAVILDLLMPGMDGFEFLRRLRRMKNGRRVPVIVWTVKDLTAEERERLQATAQAVVAKDGESTSSLLEELNAQIGSG